MKISEFDAVTNETTEREATAAEKASFDKEAAEALAAKEALETGKSELQAKKASVLAKLGLSADEVSALLA
jgi:hypothetical protein